MRTIAIVTSKRHTPQSTPPVQKTDEKKKKSEQTGGRPDTKHNWVDNHFIIYFIGDVFDVLEKLIDGHFSVDEFHFIIEMKRRKERVREKNAEAVDHTGH